MHYTWEQMAPVPGTHDESAGAQKADRERRYEANRKELEFFTTLAGEHIQVA